MSGPLPPPPPGHSARKFTTGANANDRGGHKRSTAVLRFGTTPMGPRECAGEPNGDAASVRAKPYSRPPERPPTRAAAPDYGAPPPPRRAYDPPDKRHNAALGDDYPSLVGAQEVQEAQEAPPAARTAGSGPPAHALAAAPAGAIDTPAGDASRSSASRVAPAGGGAELAGDAAPKAAPTTELEPTAGAMDTLEVVDGSEWTQVNRKKRGHRSRTPPASPIASPPHHHHAPKRPTPTSRPTSHQPEDVPPEILAEATAAHGGRPCERIDASRDGRSCCFSALAGAARAAGHLGREAANDRLMRAGLADFLDESRGEFWDQCTTLGEHLMEAAVSANLDEPVATPADAAAGAATPDPALDFGADGLDLKLDRWSATMRNTDSMGDFAAVALASAMLGFEIYVHTHCSSAAS